MVILWQIKAWDSSVLTVSSCVDNQYVSADFVTLSCFHLDNMICILTKNVWNESEVLSYMNLFIF